MFPHICLHLTVLLSLRIELHSLGKISEGEELTVAYVDFLNLSEERQRLLKTQYFFECTCEHCKNRIKDDLKLAGREVDGVKVCEPHISLYTFGLLMLMLPERMISSCTRQKGPNPLTTFSSDIDDKDRRETRDAEPL